MRVRVADSIKLTTPFVKVGGDWVAAVQGFTRVAGVWRKFYQSEIVVTLSNDTNVVLSSLFDPTVWADARIDKRVIIPDGVTIGSNLVSTPALRTGTGFAGVLKLDNSGNIDGAGGPVNGGDGGPALRSDQAGFILDNSGLIRAGGAGGGIGGVGGAGYYYTYTREPAGGYYSSANYRWVGGHKNVEDDEGNYVETIPFNTAIIWAGAYAISSFIPSSVLYDTAGGAYPTDGSPYNHSVGGYTYHLGKGASYSHIARTNNSPTVNNTSGGSPGAGGRGQGYDGANDTGEDGSAGGTSAGIGGDGADGASWGEDGGDGADGASGNNGSGANGGDGGSSGIALVNPDNISLTNTGTILG